MTKNRRWMSCALGSAAILLGGCGGGGDGGNGFDGPPSTPVPLATKADALRELGLVLGEGPISDFVEIPTATAGLSRRAKAKAAITEDCDSGRYTYEEGTKSRDFLLVHPELAVEDAAVFFERGIASNCSYVSSDGTFEFVENYNGSYEEGSSEQLDYGGALYEILGSGGTPFVERYQERINGQLTYEYESNSLGMIETYIVFSGAMSIGVLGRYSYYEKEGSFSFEASVAMGEGTTPFRAAVGESGEWAQLDGSYAYATSASACKGGKLKVTTPSEGGLAFANSRPTGGELRLESGTTTASYTFSNNGGATLVINGGTGIPLSAEEVLAAIREDQCVD